MGYIGYLCMSCGPGSRVISMSCKSSMCLRCGKVYVDEWVSQVSKMLHEGVIYRHIVLTIPEKSVTTRIAGGLISPKRALLLAPLKGILNNFSKTNTRYIISDQILFFIVHLCHTTSTFFDVEKCFVFKLCKYFHLCILFLFFEQSLIPFI